MGALDVVIADDSLSKLILFGERRLARTLAEFSAHYHGERNHQGKGNELLFPDTAAKINHVATPSSAANDLGACSSSIDALHEFFGPTGSRFDLTVQRIGVSSSTIPVRHAELEECPGAIGCGLCLTGGRATGFDRDGRVGGSFAVRLSSKSSFRSL